MKRIIGAAVGTILAMAGFAGQADAKKPREAWSVSRTTDPIHRGL